MPRFFVTNQNVRDGFVQITGKDAHHIGRSLRMAVGDSVTVCNTDMGTELDCVLSEFCGDETVIAKIRAEKRCQTESPVRIHVYQALPKGDKLDQIIQKAVECGAYDVIPFESQNCVVRIKPEAEIDKTKRRQRIATEAAKQCGRGILPTVRETVRFEQVMQEIQGMPTVFCYEGERAQTLKQYLQSFKEPPKDLAVLVGSEGGFSSEEVRKAIDVGAISVGLGPRILRTETASAFACACIAYCWEL